MLKYLQLGFLLAACSIATGQPTTRPATAPTTAVATATTTHLTIYSSATLVQQRRTLNLPEQEADIHLRDIPATADSTTISLRPLIPGSFKLLSQTYVEQVNNPDALLRRAIGHEIIINRKVPGQILPGERTRPPETINAKLLGFDQHQLVLETNNRQLPIQIIPRGPEISEIKLMASSSAAMTKPPISSRIATDKPGPHEAILTYQTSGFTWEADYDLVLTDEKTAQFTGAISIANKTRVAFDDAQITVAADPASKKSFALPRTTTLSPDATHRITIADSAKATYQMVLAYGQADHRSQFASTHLLIHNNTQNGLGIPLPFGKIRITRAGERSESPVLIAQDYFITPVDPNTPMLIRIGQPSQVHVKRQELQHRSDDEALSLQVTTKLIVRNRDEQEQRVMLIEPLPQSTWEVLDKSQAFEKQSQGMIFSITVPAGGETVVSYTTRRPAQ